MGVWIETSYQIKIKWPQRCHSLCGSVDWNNVFDRWDLIIDRVTPYVGVWIETDVSILLATPPLCHSLCGSVDWNRSERAKRKKLWRHSLCGSVDWNTQKGKRWARCNCHSLCGSVDWNVFYYTLKVINLVTPYVGVWIETDNYRSVLHGRNRHSLCGSVDWNYLIQELGLPFDRHSLCGSVDWNIHDLDRIMLALKSLLMWECGLKHHTTPWSYHTT